MGLRFRKSTQEKIDGEPRAGSERSKKWGWFCELLLTDPFPLKVNNSLWGGSGDTKSLSKNVG